MDLDGHSLRDSFKPGQQSTSPTIITSLKFLPFTIHIYTGECQNPKSWTLCQSVNFDPKSEIKIEFFLTNHSFLVHFFLLVRHTDVCLWSIYTATTYCGRYIRAVELIS